MSNTDEDSPRKFSDFEEINPDKVLKFNDNDVIPLTFEYPILKTIDGKAIAKTIMNDEMSKYLISKGLIPQEFGSPVIKKLSEDMQKTAFLLMERTGEHYINIPKVDSGTPIIVERSDKNEKFQKLNIIFTAVMAVKPREDAGNFYFIAHPVNKNGLGELSVVNQRRTDDGGFSPPVWLVEPKNPFGKRFNRFDDPDVDPDTSTHIISYAFEPK